MAGQNIMNGQILTDLQKAKAENVLVVDCDKWKLYQRKSDDSDLDSRCELSYIRVKPLPDQFILIDRKRGEVAIKGDNIQKIVQLPDFELPKIGQRLANFDLAQIIQKLANLDLQIGQRLSNLDLPQNLPIGQNLVPVLMKDVADLIPTTHVEPSVLGIGTVTYDPTLSGFSGTILRSATGVQIFRLALGEELTLKGQLNYTNNMPLVPDQLVTLALTPYNSYQAIYATIAGPTSGTVLVPFAGLVEINGRVRTVSDGFCGTGKLVIQVISVTGLPLNNGIIGNALPLQGFQVALDGNLVSVYSYMSPRRLL